MLRAFRENCARRHVKIPSHQVNWLDLHTRLGTEFDALLCRGNSLIYVGSWEDGGVPPDARQLIQEALRQFYLSLNEGGVLYVDVIGAHEYDRRTYPLRSELSGDLDDGTHVELTWEVAHDYAARTRTWRTVVHRDGRTFDQTRYGYLIRHEDLLSDLSSAGFCRVDPCRIDSAQSYSVLLVRK